MNTQTLEKPITKQQLVDQFNEALTLLDTTREDIRLNARISNTFKSPPAFECRETSDAGLLHQYALMLKSSLQEQSEDAATAPMSKALILNSRRQCYGGATLSLLDKHAVEQSAELGSKNLSRLIEESMLASETVLHAANLTLQAIANEQGVRTMLQGLLKAAAEHNASYVVASGATADMKRLLDSADAEGMRALEIYCGTSDGMMLVAWRSAKMH